MPEILIDIAQFHRPGLQVIEGVIQDRQWWPTGCFEMGALEGNYVDAPSFGSRLSKAKAGIFGRSSNAKEFSRAIW